MEVLGLHTGLSMGLFTGDMLVDKWDACALADDSP